MYVLGAVVGWVPVGLLGCICLTATSHSHWRFVKARGCGNNKQEGVARPVVVETLLSTLAVARPAALSVCLAVLAKDKKGHEPFKRLRRFFDLLYSNLAAIGACQFYETAQREDP